MGEVVIWREEGLSQIKAATRVTTDSFRWNSPAKVLEEKRR